MLECKAKLRISSDSLSLDDIIRVMGQPSNGFTKGQVFGKGKKQRLHSQWNLEVDLGNSNLQACIMKILDFYDEKDVSAIRSMCEVDIFCMLSSDNGQGSVTFDRNIYGKLLHAELSVIFDFYSD